LINPGKQFEFDQISLDLEDTKQRLKKYLNNTYIAQDEADDMVQYLENVIDSICKRQSFRLSYQHGGSPSWFVNIFRHLANCIEKENRLGILTSSMFNAEIIQEAILNVIREKGPMKWDDLADSMTNLGFDSNDINDQIRYLIHSDSKLICDVDCNIVEKKHDL